MTAKATIKSEINAKVGSSSWSAWRIGITADASGRKQEWKDDGQDISYWKHWQADSSTDAKDIEADYIAKGMKGGTGGQITSATKYVYIF